MQYWWGYCISNSVLIISGWKWSVKFASHYSSSLLPLSHNQTCPQSCVTHKTDFNPNVKVFSSSSSSSYSSFSSSSFSSSSVSSSSSSSSSPPGERRISEISPPLLSGSELYKNLSFSRPMSIFCLLDPLLSPFTKLFPPFFTAFIFLLFFVQVQSSANG